MKAYVLDTDVLVAAFRSRTGASRQVLQAARGRRFELLLSVPLMLVYESVLTRPEHLAASDATAADVSAVLDELAAIGKRVELVIRTRPMLLDRMTRWFWKRPSMVARMLSLPLTIGILDP